MLSIEKRKSYPYRVIAFRKIGESPYSCEIDSEYSVTTLEDLTDVVVGKLIRLVNPSSSVDCVRVEFSSGKNLIHLNFEMSYKRDGILVEFDLSNMTNRSGRWILNHYVCGTKVMDMPVFDAIPAIETAILRGCFK